LSSRNGATGLGHIAASKAQNYFTFIVGDHSHDCPCFVANFISPRIAHLHGSDPTIHEIQLETEDPSNQFQDFLSFGLASSVRITDSNLAFLVALAGELENSELCFALMDRFCDNTAVSTFCEQFAPFGSFDSLSAQVTDYLAMHVHKLPELFLNTLQLPAIVQMLSHDCLKIESEDALLDFISSHSEIDRDSLQLLEFVRFEFMTADAIGRFVSRSVEHFDDMVFTIAIWKAITKRLSLGVHFPVPNAARFATSFHPNSGRPLDGIIVALTKECGGNVDDKTVVKVTASGFDSSYDPKNAVDPGNGNYFQAPSAANQWLRTISLIGE
jgi:hypothetical protein